MRGAAGSVIMPAMCQTRGSDLLLPSTVLNHLLHCVVACRQAVWHGCCPDSASILQAHCQLPHCTQGPANACGVEGQPVRPFGQAVQLAGPHSLQSQPALGWCAVQ